MEYVYERGVVNTRAFFRLVSVVVSTTGSRLHKRDQHMIGLSIPDLVIDVIRQVVGTDYHFGADSQTENVPNRLGKLHGR